MKTLYKFKWDCHRMGDVVGVFVEDSKKIKSLIGKDVYFGEILGKHSEICGTLDEGDLEVLSVQTDFVESFERIVGNIGYNPVEYINE